MFVVLLAFGFRTTKRHRLGFFPIVEQTMVRDIYIRQNIGFL